MSQRKIKKRMKPATPPQPEIRLHPRAELERLRRVQRQEDDMAVYKLIHDEEFDLARKDDPVYQIQKAEALGWSRGRLAGAVQRVWDDAMRPARAQALAAGRAEKEANKKEKTS